MESAFSKRTSGGPGARRAGDGNGEHELLAEGARQAGVGDAAGVHAGEAGNTGRAMNTGHIAGEGQPGNTGHAAGAGQPGNTGHAAGAGRQPGNAGQSGNAEQGKKPVPVPPVLMIGANLDVRV